MPDLVPQPQVGLASGLAGLAQVFGNIAGTVIIVGGFVLFNDYFWPTIALGLVELATMLGTVRSVRERRSARRREGKSWVAIAREAWATDVLRERDYVWLVGSRFFFLTGAGMLINTQVFYLERSLGLEGDEKAFWIGVSTVIFGLTALAVTLPLARISDRVGRKPVIWGACLLGAIGLGLAAGPRFAEASGIVLFAVAALLLRPVHDRVHDRATRATTQRPPSGYPVP